MRTCYIMAIVRFVSTALFVSTAMAADEPEAVFAKYHRAMMKADTGTVLRLSTEAQRARIKADPAWEEQAQKMPYVIPSSYTVTGRAAGATRVVLNLDATGGLLFAATPDKPGKSRGKITLLQVDGEWLVDRVEFNAVIEPNPYQNTVRPVDPGPGSGPMMVRPSAVKPSAVRAPGAAQSATPR